MRTAMRQHARQVHDKAIICAMLDLMDTIYLGIPDEPAPYVVPLNFGYAFEEELVFFFHCAHEGYKLELLAKNPNVCVSASQFISYADGCVKGHMHDFRSVIARGVARRIDPQAEPERFRFAHEQLLIHNHRSPAQADTPAARHIQMWEIVCPAHQVTAKAEIMPRNADEVAFAPAGGDGSSLDESHVLDAKKD